MMLLAIDTSMACCSAAVFDSTAGRVVAARQQFMDKGHAEALAPMVAEVMVIAGLAFADLQRIGVTTGPGTFTGQRIGLAFARGLGLSLDIPVVGLDSLSAIAAGLGGLPIACAVISDARLDQFYFSLFDNSGIMIIAPCLTGLTAIVEALPQEPVMLLGTGAAQILAAAPQRNFQLKPELDLPVAAGFAERMAHMDEPAAMPGPLYLRAPDARPQNSALRPVADISLRLAEPPDLAGMAAIHGECFADGWTAVAIGALAATPGSITLVATEAGDLIGFAMARKAADEAEILTICTRPSLQRRGVGKALLAGVTALLGRQATKFLFLEVAADNDAALGLYRAAGFVEAGVRRQYYARVDGSAVDALVLRLELDHG